MRLMAVQIGLAIWPQEIKNLPEVKVFITNSRELTSCDMTGIVLDDVNLGWEEQRQTIPSNSFSNVQKEL